MDNHHSKLNLSPRLCFVLLTPESITHTLNKTSTNNFPWNIAQPTCNGSTLNHNQIRSAICQPKHASSSIKTSSYYVIQIAAYKVKYSTTYGSYVGILDYYNLRWKDIMHAYPKTDTAFQLMKLVTSINGHSYKTRYDISHYDKWEQRTFISQPHKVCQL